MKAAAREGTRRLGYARDNLRSLLEATQDLHERGRRLPPGPDDAQQAAFVTQDWEPLPPSKPIGEAEKKMMQVPPLIPPVLDDRLPGRPAAAPDIPDEKLIPPEMQEWYEGLEPFDQDLAKELMLVFINKGGRKGIEATRLGNADMVKELLEYLQKQRADMPGKWEHAYGSRKDGEADGDEVPEEYIEGRDSKGTKGASWPDATIRYLVEGLEPEYLRIFTGRMLKRNPDIGVKRERDQIANAEYNKPGELMVLAPKLLADRPDGVVSPEARHAYRQQAREFAAKLGPRIEAVLKAKGKL
ncbi:hypothetical protein [Ferrovibrio sp.]|uniref:hypothetical protein n=1 Tax=Ferrovibrio sp. TaxID=1917215 RepID=UPI00311F0843